MGRRADLGWRVNASLAAGFESIEARIPCERGPG